MSPKKVHDLRSHKVQPNVADFRGATLGRLNGLFKGALALANPCTTPIGSTRSHEFQQWPGKFLPPSPPPPPYSLTVGHVNPLAKSHSAQTAGMAGDI